MRVVTVFSSILLFAALSVGQSGTRSYPSYCPYGCGPYVPLISTPSLTFVTVSPNPVGATNATTGLIAGATNSTLSEISGNTDSVYSVPVWYSGGGSPLVAPAVNSAVGGMRMNAMHHERFEEPQQERAQEGTARSWVYLASAQPGARSLESVSGATGVHPAKKNYTNDDVQRQNEKNGTVRWDGKSEKIQ
jgi:hypothetical protein